MKRSSKGKAYFYAYGQQDKLLLGGSRLNTSNMVMIFRLGWKWPMWAQESYQNGFNGY